ncbi:hypothetical protein [Rhodococcus sp. IEGM 1379]|uniref:hypothetical protein n=1 Tax=Rhodococcus sp. IEGM 1379 TaxID=3047086 RepID=UPI0024B7D115|nr:hypothetical protein [Rhodococcus sp. IEGM 1379]MDI9914249.1 hypothetical protein [Rhodococcus sp. IEGM 1379]
MADQSMIGADVAALRNFARELDRAAVDVRAARKYVNAIVVNNGAWFGPNFGMFVAAWAKLAINLTQVSEQLEAAGRTVRANADAQAAVSGDLGAHAIGLVGSAGGAASNSPRTSATLAGFLNQASSADGTNENGIRIQTVIGADTEKRYVVSIAGSGGGASGDWSGWDPTKALTWWENLPVANGFPGWATLEVAYTLHLMGVPNDAEILFVGHSQGGAHAEMLAESGFYPHSSAINEGGPRVPGGTGANILRLEGNSAADNLIESLSMAGERVRSLPYDPLGLSMLSRGNDGAIFQAHSARGNIYGGHLDHAAFGRAADQFEASDDPKHQALQERLSRFTNSEIYFDTDPR